MLLVQLVLSINIKAQIRKKKKEKISSCEQTQGWSQSLVHQCFRKYHIISNILPTEIQGEMDLHCFVTAVNDPQHS